MLDIIYCNLIREMNDTYNLLSTVPPGQASYPDVGLVYDLMATIVFVIVICILLLQFMIFVFRQQWLDML